MIFWLLRGGFRQLQAVQVRQATEDCELEILYFDIQLFCHTSERPAFQLGRGEFSAEDHLGNFQLNDTILQKVKMLIWAFGDTIGWWVVEGGRVL